MSPEVPFAVPGFGRAFWVNFQMMFKEEWRQNVDFAKKRHIMLFPAMLALVTMAITIGLRFLTGDTMTDAGLDTLQQAEKSFTWDELKLGLHLSLFTFALGMGSFAFIGRTMVSQRGGGKSYLLASPALQPLHLTPVYFAYYCKEVAFYLLMILTPCVIGMGMGILVGAQIGIETSLLTSSLPVVLLCMLLTMMQGLALSFFASALWSRGRVWVWVLPVLGAAVGIAAATDFIPVEWVVLGLNIQLTHDFSLAFPAFAGALLLAWAGARLVPEDFELQVSTRDDLFEPIHRRLGWLGNGPIRILVAKEMTDMLRSGALLKMLGSYCVPLLFLLGLAWLADFARFPIPFNLLSYAPFLGFFGFNFYSWLNAVDPPDFYNNLPVRVPQLLRAKIIVYFLMTTWISVLFLVFMAWLLDQFEDLLGALLVMLANSVYIVAFAALLMGLRPNKAIFDFSAMGPFYLGTAVPLVMLFLLSFTQGDLSLYANWQAQVRADGTSAEAVQMELEERASVTFEYIVYICAVLLTLAGAFLLLIERRWGKAAFEN